MNYLLLARTDENGSIKKMKIKMEK